MTLDQYGFSGFNKATNKMKRNTTGKLSHEKKVKVSDDHVAIRLLFLPKKRTWYVDVFFEDDVAQLASKPIMSCNEECDQYLKAFLRFQLGVILWFGEKANRFHHIARSGR